MKRVTSKPSREPVPEVTMSRLRAAAALHDDEIDLTDPDAPEMTDWTGSVRGRFYQPTETGLARIDPDVMAYFQSSGPDYQSRINRVLRASML